MSIAQKFEVIADEVYEKGKKDEYDKFWDSFQNYGNRTGYQSGFAGKGWNDKTFKPKYDIAPIGNLGSAFQETELKDLAGALNECGVVLDTSQATTLTNLFYYSYLLITIPTIDSRGSTESNVFSKTFSTCRKLKTIEKLILKEDGSQIFSSTFSNCLELENIVIEGTIGQNGFNVKDSKNLTVASLLSILTALSKDSSIATGKSITFSTVHKDIIEGDAECLEQYNLAISAGWEFLYA